MTANSGRLCSGKARSGDRYGRMERSPSNHVGRRALVIILVALGLFLVAVVNGAGAGASPSNAKTELHGAFSRENQMSGTFVVNDGNNHTKKLRGLLHI